MRTTYDPAGKLVAVAVEHVAYCAIMLNVESVEWSTDSQKWATQSDAVYALPADIDAATASPEVIRKYGVIVRQRHQRLTLPRLRSDFAYAVALHELGHVACGANEGEAWQWAYNNALYWSPLMWRLACRALGGYAIAYPDIYPRELVLEVLHALTPFNMEE